MGHNKFKPAKKSKKYENKELTQGHSAATGFMVHIGMWKNYDYRCLKPKDGVKPENWPHYDMIGLREANTVEALEKVKEIPFDNNFFNFEDPKVWSSMLNLKTGPRLWKETYGFDDVFIVEGKDGKADTTKCFKKCIEAEQSNFARECKKEGGLFKCCKLG